MARSLLPFLMFQGECAAAIDFYQSVFPDMEVEEIARHGDEAGDGAGLIKLARVRIAGQAILVNDSPVKHGFTFTPSSSFFVECGSEEELRRAAGLLSDGGQELMPVGDYGFSTLFAWVQDRFGVSWQLNLGAVR